MSARDQVLDHLADNIEPGPAKILAVRAGAKRGKFPAGDIDVRGLWSSILEQLEAAYGQQAFERLFDALVKEYPRTVEESRALLEATRDATGARKRPSSRARRIRVYDGDDEVWWISRAGEVSFDVWVSAKAKGEPAPQLVVAGEGPDDIVEISDAEPDRKAEWWVYEVTLSRTGPQRRNLEFRVADNAKTKQSLTIVSPWLWYPAGAAVLAASTICIAVYVATFRRIPGAGWSAIIGVLPALPILVGILSLAPPMAKLRTLFLYPAQLVLAASVILVLAVIPGLFLVAVENGTSDMIRIGKGIAPDDWIVVAPGTLDRDGARLCRTEPKRSVGLDAFLPRSLVTGAASKWPVLGARFDDKTILKAAGGMVQGSNVVLPCDRSDAVVPSAEVRYRDVTLHVPHPWSVSVVSGSGGGSFHLDPPAEGSDTLPETEVLSSAGGTLRCSGSGRFLIEQVVADVPARSLSFVSFNGLSSSKWHGITTAWRCVFAAEETEVTIVPVEKTSTLDLVLPAELGRITLQFASVTAVIKPENRFVHVRPLQAPPAVDGRTAFIDGGNLRVASGLAIISKTTPGLTAASFVLETKTYKLSVNSDGSLKIVVDEMPRGSCTYFVADKKTQRGRPAAGLNCSKYPEYTDDKDAKRIASDQRKKRYACTDVYICRN